MSKLIKSKSETDFFFLNENTNLINFNLNNISKLKTVKKTKFAACKEKSKTQTFSILLIT